MIFEDPTRLRWKLAIIFLVVMGIGAMCLAVDLSLTSLMTPELSQSQLDRHSATTRPNDRLVGEESIESLLTTTAPATSPAPVRPASIAAILKGGRPFVRSAFIVQDDASTLVDLPKILPSLDVVFPDWYSFATADGELQENIKPEMTRALMSSHALVLPRLANTDSTGGWHGKILSKFFRDPKAAEGLINELVDQLVAAHVQGVNVDIEELQGEDKEIYLDWLNDLAGALHRHHLLLTVDVPLNDGQAFDYEAIGRIADATVLMAYDEHYSSGNPGPIASIEWFQDGVNDMVKRIPAEKLIVALGAYGYDWNLTHKQEARSMGFLEVMRLARQVGAHIQIQEPSLNATFSYSDSQGDKHEVWFLDAVSAWDEFLELRRTHCCGVSLWRLGNEDQGLWTFLNSPDSDQFDPATLSTVEPLATVIVRGDGNLFAVPSTAEDGERDISVDKKFIDWAQYVSTPTYFAVHRLGDSTKKQIALTFDDGPDPVWTPKVLQVLSRYGVRATFFLVGQQVQNQPEIVNDEMAGGHVLGSHTWSHTDITDLSPDRLRHELDITQRAIESVTGHQTLLFRTPYSVDNCPTDGPDLSQLYEVTKMGYTTVGADIDSQDFTKPGVDKMIHTVTSQLGSGPSHVILFHDAGTDRQQTVDALDKLIPMLQKQGYEFVTIDELIGVPRDAIMPTLPSSEKVLTLGVRFMNALHTWGWRILVILFLITTLIAIGRIVMLGIFVLRSQWHQREDDLFFTPPVMVLIPAYNEGKVIQRTLRSVLKSTYPDFTICVVDDGSTDDTAQKVQELAAIHPQITLVTKPNGGKCSALDMGFNLAPQEYIVTIDADTIICPQTISRLIAPFADPKITAVCGNVQVGNVKNLLTSFQDVEYVTSQNYDRRAFESLNCISVVPGATGAWRRDAVLQVGGYSAGTLTEDADLTLTILEHGGRILYAPLAKSMTEAPEKLKPLFKQRFRWSFGTFQCLWKHRRSFGRGTLGLVALPNMLMFQILFPVLAPIGDVVMLLSLFRGDIGAIAAGYFTFLVMDLVGSLVAFGLDRRSISSVWVVLIQRFYYRQFMYIVTFRALLAALSGRRHGWNKLDRKASVSHKHEAVEEHAR